VKFEREIHEYILNEEERLWWRNGIIKNEDKK
jgi:hypothetical protein